MKTNTKKEKVEIIQKCAFCGKKVNGIRICDECYKIQSTIIIVNPSN